MSSMSLSEGDDDPLLVGDPSLSRPSLPDRRVSVRNIAAAAAATTRAIGTQTDDSSPAPTILTRVNTTFSFAAAAQSTAATPTSEVACPLCGSRNPSPDFVLRSEELRRRFFQIQLDTDQRLQQYAQQRQRLAELHKSPVLVRPKSASSAPAAGGGMWAVQNSRAAATKAEPKPRTKPLEENKGVTKRTKIPRPQVPACARPKLDHPDLGENPLDHILQHVHARIREIQRNRHTRGPLTAEEQAAVLKEERNEVRLLVSALQAENRKLRRQIGENKEPLHAIQVGGVPAVSQPNVSLLAVDDVDGKAPQPPLVQTPSSAEATSEKPSSPTSKHRPSSPDRTGNARPASQATTRSGRDSDSEGPAPRRGRELSENTEATQKADADNRSDGEEYKDDAFDNDRGSSSSSRSSRSRRSDRSNRSRRSSRSAKSKKESS
eukprot:TRINITY_DN11902_c0_g1_i1.p1 TRINITY_DN11902_c0_g1~~TRINITY_DN11902_c0_g1_i1.p1  ORF type:complete len:444 (-),score=37.69 TRINITY_DN11902_c0_g1_i1:12-1316(-)